MSIQQSAYEFSFQKKRKDNREKKYVLKQNLNDQQQSSRQRSRSTIRVARNIQIDKFDILEHVKSTNQSLSSRKFTSKPIMKNQSLVVEASYRNLTSGDKVGRQEQIQKPLFIRKINQHWKKLINSNLRNKLSISLGPKMGSVSRQLIL